jgi:tripartite ATP-independent transporter DctP family solute receptor
LDIGFPFFQILFSWEALNGDIEPAFKPAGQHAWQNLFFKLTLEVIMKSKKMFVVFVVVMAVVLASSVNAKTPLKMYSSHPAGYPATTSMEKFAELVNAEIPGKWDFKVYLSMSLGDENSGIDQTRFGAIHFGVYSMGPLSDTVKELQFLSLPYLFKSPDHMYRVMDGPIGRELEKYTEKYGLVTLGWHGAGARSFYTRTGPIKTPADLNGLKIRVQKSQIMADMVEALGGKPTPLPFTEVFTAIKTGVVDGAENNIPSYESTGHFEVAPYYSFDFHTTLPEILVVSKKLWDSLTDKEKEVFRRAGIESTKFQRDEWAKRVKRSRDIVEKGGAKFSKADVAAFQAKVSPVWEKYMTEDAKVFVEKIKAQD